MLAIGTLCVLFFILEILLRTTHLFGARISWSIPDPFLGWRFKPGKYWSFQENDHPITWSVNRFGWKDKEWSLEKSEGTIRVAVLGDSYVEALQVEPERNFLSLVEQEWDKTNHPQIELMNFSRSAFTQTEEWLVLQRDVLKFAPDAVVLFFYPPNDINDMSQETAFDPLRPFFHLSSRGRLFVDTSFNKSFKFKLKSVIQHFKTHSLLVSFLTERYTLFDSNLRARKLFGRVQKTNPTLQGYLTLCTSAPDPLFLKNYELSKFLIQRMASLLKEKKKDLLLVSIDLPAYLPEVEEQYKKIDATFNPNFFDEDLQKLAQSLNIPFLGLQKAFREEYRQNPTSLHWEKPQQRRYEQFGTHTGHWNERGHQVVAQAFLNELIKWLSKEHVIISTD